MPTNRTKSKGAASAAPDGPARYRTPWDDQTADDVFATVCMVDGFDLRGFDAWLNALPSDSGASRELSERRALALDAFRTDPRNRDSYHRHLEWMMLRRRAIDRHAALLPLARAGKSVAAGRSEGGKKAAEHRRQENAARDARIVKRAKLSIQSGEATPRTVSALLVDRNQSDGLGIKQVRAILRQAGVR